MLDSLSSLATNTTFIMCSIFALSQLFGRMLKKRVFLFLIFSSIAYLNLHLELLVSKNLLQHVNHFLIYIPVLLLLGPVLKLFFESLQEEKALSFKKEAPYFIPCLMSFVIFPFLFTLSTAEKIDLISSLYQAPSQSIYSYLSLLAILIFSFFIFKIASIQPNYFKKEVPLTQKGLSILLGISCFSFIVLLSILSLVFGSLWILKLSTILFFLPFLTLSLIYLRYPDFFDLWQSDIQEKHYQKTHLKGVSVSESLTELRTLLNDEKVFTDPELTLSRLANKMDLNPHQLSELINANLDKSFTQLLNSYRIEEAKKILQDDHIRTTLSIGFKVGFNSYSSFYQRFKQSVGESPSDYRKRFEK